MLYSYNDCISSFGNDYQIKKSVSNGKLFKICNGIYSDKEYVSELEIVCFKYPMAVFTMDSAFYYHSLTDVIPEAYHLATDKNATKIKKCEGESPKCSCLFCFLPLVWFC